jgi:polar amino acid transport system permease protein
MTFLQDLLLLFRYLLAGLGITLGVSLIAITIGFTFGVLLAIVRVYGGCFFSQLAAIYSTAVRAIPVVVIIFLLYFVIARAVDLSPFLAGSVALGFSSAAYQSEVFRGAFQSVPGGQMLAARAMGMSRIQAIRYVILPQAIRLAIPPWSNEAAIVLKDSSLVYILGVPEILRRAEYVSAVTLQPFLAFGAAALIYFFLTFSTNRGLDWLERRYRILM